MTRFLRRLELKAGLEKSLSFGKLKKSLNCSGKRVKGREKFVIFLSWMHQISVSFFLEYLLYAIEWSTGRRALNYRMKMPYKALNLFGILAQEPWYDVHSQGGPVLPWLHHWSYHLFLITYLNWRAPWKNRIHLYISFFRPSLNRVLFPMFCLLVEGECQIVVF